MNSVDEKEKVIIPTSAIRYRIIANSNSFVDQEEKMRINTEIEPILENILLSSKNINESRTNIFNNMSNIEDVINKYNVDYDINYGINYFPDKEYKGLKYQAGDYESLVITLGNGLGDNWWCVLFPPLCLIEAKENDLDEVTYTTYISDIINRFN